MIQGKIIKGIAGFYYVHGENDVIYECRAKGVFRKNQQKPLVGDDVEIEILSEECKTGNVTRILERKNALIRPAVANIDRALVIFAVTQPKPNFNLLNRFLVMMEKQGIETAICFNKTDAAQDMEIAMAWKAYEKSGYPLLFTSAMESQGMDNVLDFLRGKTTVVAGPSGVGKSSIINRLQNNVEMETGSISEKIERGKHTTRHSELILVEKDTYIMDTPGFSSLFVSDYEKEELKGYFPEFHQYEDECRFQGCVHVHEPDCGVKAAVKQGSISQSRYESYLEIFEEVKNQKRY